MKDDQKKSKNIPDNHKRSLSITARHIEKNIYDIENLLKSKSDNYLTEHIIRNVNDKNSIAILDLLKILKNKNEDFFNELQLDQNILSEKRILISKISYIWTIQCDSSARALKGYGELTEGQSNLIDRHVNGMLEIVDKIQSLLTE